MQGLLCFLTSKLRLESRYAEKIKDARGILAWKPRKISEDGGLAKDLRFQTSPSDSPSRFLPRRRRRRREWKRDTRAVAVIESVVARVASKRRTRIRMTEFSREEFR